MILWLINRRKLVSLTLIILGAVLFLTAIGIVVMDYAVKEDQGISLTEGWEIYNSFRDQMGADGRGLFDSFSGGAMNMFGQERPEEAAKLKLALFFLKLVPHKTNFFIFGALLMLLGFLFLKGRILPGAPEAAAASASAAVEGLKRSASSLYSGFQQKATAVKDALSESSKASPTHSTTPAKPASPPAPVHTPVAPPVYRPPAPAVPKKSSEMAAPRSSELICSTCGKAYAGKTFVNCPHCALRKTASTSTGLASEPASSIGMQQAGDL